MTPSSANSKLKFILALIVVPLIFAMIIGGILAQMFGLFNFAPMARNIPMVGEFVPKEDPDEPMDREEELQRWAEELAAMQEELEEERAELERKERELEELEEELREREADLDAWEADLKAEEETMVAREERLEQLANTFEEMRPADAAEMLENQGNELALEILNRLPNDHKADILTEMDSARAAELTRLLGS